MARTKTPPNKESTLQKTKSSAPTADRKKTLSVHQRIVQWTKKLQVSNKAFLARRPHRSFQRTKRRDYVRSLDIPGYWAFSMYVAHTLLTYKKLFGTMLLFYVVAGIALVGLASQDTYSQLSSLLEGTAVSWDAVAQSGVLLLTGLSGGLNASYTEAQQIFSILLLVLIWLAVVWSLRVILAGSKTPRLRDALYNSGAPLVSTAIVVGIIILQLLPFALATLVIGSGAAVGMFDSPTMSLILSFVAAGLGVLSLYWITSSVMALVVITLPGMYPWRAIQTAGDLVIGRRVRILLRLCWMLACAVVFSAIIVLPVILIDRLIKQAIPAIEWLPIVPAVLAVMSAAVLIWSAGYVYLLYRKIVEDDSSPA